MSAQWHVEYEYSLANGPCPYISKKSLGMRFIIGNSIALVNTFDAVINVRLKFYTTKVHRNSNLLGVM